MGRGKTLPIRLGFKLASFISSLQWCRGEEEGDGEGEEEGDGGSQFQNIHHGPTAVKPSAS